MFQIQSPLMEPTEEDLQDWICEAYTNLGYHVYNLHRLDRKYEAGVDIMCEKPGEKLVIQVKIRPKKKDVKQLETLARFDANKRIYGYWNTPTIAFSEVTKQINNVEYFDHDKLERLLINGCSPSFLRWYFLCSPTIENVVKFLLALYKGRTARPRKYEKGDLKTLWRMKSCSVKLRHGVWIIYELFREELLSQLDETTSYDYVKKIRKGIDLQKYISQELLDISDNIKTQSPHLFYNFWQICKPRTGWSELFLRLEQERDQDLARARIRKWLIEPTLPSPLSSVPTWLIGTLDNLEDRFDLFSMASDWLFDGARKELFKL